MIYRAVACCMLLVALGTFLISCASSPTLSSIQVTPATAAVALTGQTVQFRALGTYVNGGHPTQTRDITDSVTWASSDTTAATINSTGLATVVGTGDTSITASMEAAPSGLVMGTADLTSAGGTPNDLTALSIIPGLQSLTLTNETAQFIAIGTFDSPPITRDMTDQVTWQISDVQIATIDSSGLATGVGPGTATVTAIGTAVSGNVITATATLAETGTGKVTLPTLTVYKVGLGTGTVVSSPAGINCGSGAACTGNFVLGSAVTLTATPGSGSTFGGWSSNCTPSTTTTCTVTMGDNQTVGAIFN